MIGAQEIAARWAGQPVYQMDFSRLIGSHYTGKNADENQEQYDRSPESAQRLLLQPPSQQQAREKLSLCRVHAIDSESGDPNGNR